MNVDAPVLSGLYPETCFAKYNCFPLRARYVYIYLYDYGMCTDYVHLYYVS